MPCQRVDKIAAEVGAIGRRKRSALLALEVILQDQFVVVLGKNQVDAGPLEISIEKQLRVGDELHPKERAARETVWPRRMRTRTVIRQLGIKFADDNSIGPPQRLIFI